MQRWHLTAGLAGAAALAAFLAPVLAPTLRGAPPEPVTVLPGGAVVPTPPAAQDGVLELRAALDQGSLLQGRDGARYLVLEVSAPDLPGDVRRPVNLAVVMDTSGSMAGRGKIDNARMAARELVRQLRPEDRFSLVTFSDAGRVIVESTPADDPARLERLISGIRPGGGTHLSAGLELGLEQLDQAELEGVRRVVLLSDGMANIGVTDVDTLARTAGSRVDAGVTVSALGLGLEFNEDLLTAMSDAGGGQYHFVDRPGQLAAMFEQELQQMTRVAGREVAVEVELLTGVRLLEVYGWSTTPTSEGFQVFMGDVHGGETRKIVARVDVPDDALGAVEVAEVALRYTDVEAARPAVELAAVQAEITRDARVAQASLDRKAGVSAARAHAGKLLDEGARSFDEGDVATNRAKLDEARGLLRTLGAAYDAEELQADEVAVAAQQQAFSAAPPASEEALFQVKAAKEAARGYSR